MQQSLAGRRGLLRPFALVLVAFDKVAGWAIVGLISAMVALVSGQVLLRYAMNSSMGFADELSRLTFVWSIFLAIPLGVRLGVHIGMELLTARLSAPVQNILVRLMAAGAAAMMTLVAWQSAVVAFDQWDEGMASMQFSAAWFIVAVAVGSTHSALHLAWIVLTGKPTHIAGMETE
ncbi:MAG: TRAP transporter small permease [Cupriavidus necator]